MIFKSKRRTPMPVLIETDKKDAYQEGNGLTIQVENPSPRSALEERINDKKEIVNKYLDALLNGTAISQLTITDDLTDFAKNALVELQELTMNNSVVNAKEELESLRANYTEMKTQLDNMKPLYEELVEVILPVL